mgnify:CR=1 FL=1
MQTIQVDVVSDIVCPWCYIGKRRLESALAQLNNRFPIEITYHPFQLDPSVPPQGKDFVSYMHGRYGSQIEGMFSRVEQVGQQEGLDFDFLSIPKAINTLPLHQMLRVAHQEGIQAEVKEALMTAYFVDRLDLSNPNNVAMLMEPFGWSTTKTLDLLRSADGLQEVQDEIRYYQQMGVTGVPFFILNNKYGISGAQPAEVLKDAIEQVAQELGIEPLTTEDGFCDVTTGEC